MRELTVKNIPELPFDVKESLNQLRVSLGLFGQDIKTIMITSSLPNEGKSFIAVNLWKMMADVGIRVALIDCDLRKSEMRTKYGISIGEDQTGIVHYLAGKSTLEDTVYRTNIPNGYLVPLITNMNNPSILLENKRFEELMQSCRSVFDCVIVDTPPLGSVADALNIGTNCDGTLLVVRSGEAPRKLVSDSVELLRRTGKPLLGVVLNRVDVNRRSYSYYYGRYYRYGSYYKKYGKYGYKQYGGKSK